MAKAGQKHAAAGGGSIRKVEKVRNGRKYVYFEARATIGRDPSGKQQQKSFTAKSQKEAQEWLNKTTAAVDAGTYFQPVSIGDFQPEKITVEEWFEIWLSDYQAAVKPLTVQQYRSMSQSHIYPALGPVKLCKLTSPQLQKFFNQLAVDGKKQRRKNPKTGEMEIVGTGEPLSPKTIRNVFDIMSKAINTAIQQGLIKDNPLQRVTIPKVIRADVSPLTEEQQRAFLEAIKGHQYELPYITLLFTGLREGELLGLSWDCVDWKRGTLKVYRQLQRTPGAWSDFRFVPLKNSKSRVIRLSPYILGLLETHKTKQQEKRLAVGAAWQGFDNLEEQQTALIFTDTVGRAINPAPFYENFKKVAALIGIPSARVHDLRHSFAVNSLQCGDSPKLVQEALGHATAAFTLNVYGHVSERMMEEHAARQQEFINGLLSKKQA